MHVLVSCECSATVVSAFRAKGHIAFSCDIQQTQGHPLWHYKQDVLELLRWDTWDIVIAHPPCTDLCTSGARWFPEKIADGRQQAAIEFFMEHVNMACSRWAIENPIGVMSTKYRKPDQIIQPWQFGHGETKATCLWLKNLPLLQPTKIVDGRDARIHRLPPSPNRAQLRSKTYFGIAAAMAAQWGDL